MIVVDNIDCKINAAVIYERSSAAALQCTILAYLFHKKRALFSMPCLQSFLQIISAPIFT